MLCCRLVVPAGGGVFDLFFVLNILSAGLGVGVMRELMSSNCVIFIINGILICLYEIKISNCIFANCFLYNGLRLFVVQIWLKSMF